MRLTTEKALRLRKFARCELLQDVVRQMRAGDDLVINGAMMRRDFERFGGMNTVELMTSFSSRTEVRYPGHVNLIDDLLDHAYEHGLQSAARMMAPYDDSEIVPDGPCRMAAELLHYTTIKRKELSDRFENLDAMLEKAHVYMMAMRAESELVGWTLHKNTYPRDRIIEHRAILLQSLAMRQLYLRGFAPRNRAHLRLLIDRAPENGDYFDLLSATLASVEAERAIDELMKR
jgi:hypothetical protein